MRTYSPGVLLRMSVDRSPLPRPIILWSCGRDKGKYAAGQHLQRKSKQRKAKFGEQQIKNEEKIDRPHRQYYFEPLPLCMHPLFDQRYPVNMNHHAVSKWCEGVGGSVCVWRGGRWKQRKTVADRWNKG